MSTMFGLYVTAIGVGLVFFSLLIVAVLSRVLTRVFRNQQKPIEETGDNRKIAAVSAVFASMEGSPKEVSSRDEAYSRWKTTARSEAVSRREDR